jgi:hypothetical protein
VASVCDFGWLYEPKVGFRCLVFHDGEKVDLQSKKQKPINRTCPRSPPGLPG